MCVQPPPKIWLRVVNSPRQITRYPITVSIWSSSLPPLVSNVLKDTRILFHQPCRTTCTLMQYKGDLLFGIQQSFVLVNVFIFNPPPSPDPGVAGTTRHYRESHSRYLDTFKMSVIDTQLCVSTKQLFYCFVTPVYLENRLVGSQICHTPFLIQSNPP